MRDKGLKEALERARHLGTHGDTVLAHINPEEARMLSQYSGGRHINPNTGLPAFWRPLHQPFGKKGGPLRKHVLPVLARVAAGPIGGAIHDALQPHKGNVLKNVARGIPKSIAMNAAMALGALGAMGQGPFGGIGNMLSGGQGGFFGGAGPAVTGGAGGIPGMPQAGGQQQAPQGGGMFGGLFGGGQGGGMFDMFGGPLNAGLLGAGLYGMAKGKSKIPHEAPPDIAAIKARQYGPEFQYRRVKPAKERRYIEPPAGYRPGIDPEHKYFEDENPGELEYYGHGGYVDGEDGGQDDNFETSVPKKSFIMDATTVSLLGDGNSLNGKKKIREMESHLSRSGIIRNPKVSENVRVALSPAEYAIRPEFVEALGNGNNEAGARKLIKMRKKIRVQKGLKKFLPPKAKPITSYMR